MLPRRRESEVVLHRLQELVRHLFPNADRAVALHVGVATQRSGARARFADVAGQQQRVHHFTDRAHGVPVLGHAEGPADHAGFGLFDGVGGV